MLWVPLTARGWLVNTDKDEDLDYLSDTWGLPGWVRPAHSLNQPPPRSRLQEGAEQRSWGTGSRLHTSDYALPQVGDITER